MQRLKVITSYTGHARFLAECDEEPAGWIARQADIPSPYSYGPDHAVWAWGNRKVIIVETRHKRYEVFEVPPGMPVSQEQI